MRQELETMLRSNGWQQDRFGHFHKDVAVTNKETGVVVKRPMRFKMQKLTCRVEVKSETIYPAFWIKRTGCYYGEIKRLDDGRLLVGRLKVGKKPEVGNV